MKKLQKLDGGLPPIKIEDLDLSILIPKEESTAIPINPTTTATAVLLLSTIA